MNNEMYRISPQDRESLESSCKLITGYLKHIQELQEEIKGHKEEIRNEIKSIAEPIVGKAYAKVILADLEYRVKNNGESIKEVFLENFEFLEQFEKKDK